MTAPVSLASLTAEHLSPLLGQTFAITLPQGPATQGVLETVTPLPASPGATRRAFSFVFLVPAQAPRPVQGPLRFEHPSLGALEVFAVPVGQHGGAIRWEIVFG
jgi:hypothetical protein